MFCLGIVLKFEILWEVLIYLSEYVTKDGAVGSVKDGNTERGKSFPIQAWTGL